MTSEDTPTTTVTTTERYPVRLPVPLKRAFLKRAGHRRAAGIVVAFIRWWMRMPGAKLPERPPVPNGGV